MATPVIFDYEKFYNFYTKHRLPWEKTPPEVKFYHDDTEHTKTKQGRYCIIHAQKMYIETIPQKGDMLGKGLLFSILRDENGTLWDDHYHFGIKDGRAYGIPSVIYFHKTTQNTVEQTNDASHCWFPSDQDIRNVDLIDCINVTNRKGVTMSSNDMFPITTDDFKLIETIIQLPFYNLLTSSNKPTSALKSPKTGGKRTRNNIIQTRCIRTRKKAIRRTHRRSTHKQI